MAGVWWRCFYFNISDAETFLRLHIADCCCCGVNPANPVRPSQAEIAAMSSLVAVSGGWWSLVAGGGVQDRCTEAAPTS